MTVPSRLLAYLLLSAATYLSCSSDDGTEAEDIDASLPRQKSSGAGGTSGTSGQAGSGASPGFPSGSLGGSGNPAGAAGAPAGSGGTPAMGFGGGTIFGGGGQGGDTGAAGQAAGQGGQGAGQGGQGAGQGGAPAAGNGGQGNVGNTGGASCVPDCSGRQCGPDPKCGVSCGLCNASATCTPQGTCQEACKPAWSTPLAGLTGIGQIRAAGGSAFAVGHKSGVPWVGKLSLCSGAIQQEASAPLPGTLSSKLSGLTFANNTLHISGTTEYPSDPGEGVYIAATTDLQVLTATPLFGSPNHDELVSIAVTSAGNLWFAGTSNTTPALDALGVWSVKGTSGGKYCGFPAASTFGVGRATATSGADVWIAGASGGTAYLARFADGSCGADDPCGCAFTASNAIKIGEVSTEIRGLLHHAGALYASGFASDGSDLFGFVARISTATLAAEQVFRWNPTPDIEALLDITTNGTRLFIGGGQGWKGEEDLSTAQGVLMALPINFTSSSSVDWIKYPPGSRAFFGISVSGTDLVASAKSASALVVHCSTDGLCP